MAPMAGCYVAFAFECSVLCYTRVKRDLTRVKRIYHPLNLDGGRNWNNPGEMSIHPPNSSPPPQITPLVPYRYLRYYMYR